MNESTTMTCADLLIHLLRDTYGVRALFGIPGVHTVELYRGLEGSGRYPRAMSRERGLWPVAMPVPAVSRGCV